MSRNKSLPGTSTSNSLLERGWLNIFFSYFYVHFPRIIETQSENRVNLINDTVCRNSVWKEQNILKIIFFISTTLLTGWVILGVLIKKYVLFIKSRSVLAFDCWRIWHLSWTVWNIYACQICRIFLARVGHVKYLNVNKWQIYEDILKKNSCCSIFYNALIFASKHY